MKFTTEYLIMCSDAESFCDSIESLTHYFCLDSRIKMRNGKIHFGDPKIEATYKVNRGEIAEKKQSYFQISFSIEVDGEVVQKDIDVYIDLLKAIKVLIYRVEWHIEVLWDDVSSYYANKAYPLIHEIESLMRKLIQNFMLITIGRDWTKSSLPKEVLDIFSKSKRKEESNQLHSLDFIDLAAILVKPYSTVTAEDLHKRIREANSKNDIDSLKELIPQSNWKRYFSKIISTCEDAQLEKKWKELYDLRCKVAHNSIVSKLDYDSIVAIAGDLKIILCDALDKLPKVSVPENERETVAEAAAVNINSLYGEFVSSWKLLLKVIHAPAQSQKFTSILSCSKYLVENGYINEDSRKIIEGLSRIRNDIVQRPIANYGESFMTELVDVLKNVIEVIKAQIEAKSKLDDPEAFDSID